LCWAWQPWRCRSGSPRERCGAEHGRRLGDERRCPDDRHADSSGNGIDGAIAANAAPMLTTGVVFGTDTVFPVGERETEPAAGHPATGGAGRQPGVEPGRARLADLVPLPHLAAVRQHHAEGSATTNGGQIKFQLPKGQISCCSRVRAGRRSIKTVGAYDDNLFHVVVCTRLTTG
jgi:hypothetical protein